MRATAEERWVEVASAHMKRACKACHDMPEAECDAKCRTGDDGCYAQRKALCELIEEYYEAGYDAHERLSGPIK